MCKSWRAIPHPFHFEKSIFPWAFLLLMFHCAPLLQEGDGALFRWPAWTRGSDPHGGGRSSRRPRAANTGKVARVQDKADTRTAYATGVSLHTAQADAPALTLHFFDSLGKIRRFQALSPHRLHSVPALWLS